MLRPFSLLFGGRFGNPSVFVGVGEGPVSREHFIVGRIQIRLGPAAFPLLVFHDFFHLYINVVLLSGSVAFKRQ